MSSRKQQYEKLCSELILTQLVKLNPNNTKQIEPLKLSEYYPDDLTTLGVLELICLGCGQQTIVDDFKRFKGNQLTTTCQSVCRIKKQRKSQGSSYVKGRIKRREQDEAGFLARNAEIQRKWREKNKGYVKKELTQTRLNPHHRFMYYKLRAEKSQLTFDITEDYATKLFKGQCAYCLDIADEHHMNGIDRVDSSIGYEIDNCITTCEMCNFMKFQLDPISFVEICGHILANLGIINNYTSSDILDVLNGCMSGTHQTYSYSASKKEYEFNLTPNDFDQITRDNCYLCGITTESPFNRNGVDRIDNSIGYEINNCLACCAGCNYMKSSYTLEDFVSKLLDIHNNNLIYNYLPNIDPIKNEIVNHQDMIRLHLNQIESIDLTAINTILEQSIDRHKNMNDLISSHQYYYLSNAKPNQPCYFKLSKYIKNVKPRTYSIYDESKSYLSIKDTTKFNQLSLVDQTQLLLEWTETQKLGGQSRPDWNVLVKIRSNKIPNNLVSFRKQHTSTSTKLTEDEYADLNQSKVELRNEKRLQSQIAKLKSLHSVKECQELQAMKILEKDLAIVQTHIKVRQDSKSTIDISKPQTTDDDLLQLTNTPVQTMKQSDLTRIKIKLKLKSS